MELDYLKKPSQVLKSQIANLQATINQEMLKNQDEIRQTIRERWLLGKDPLGYAIGIYSKSDIGAEYAFFKNKINPKAGLGNVDLTLTGALGKKIRLVEVSNGFEVISTDEKFEAIKEKYGDYNFNLSESERKELFDEILLTILTQAINKAYE